MIDDLTRQWIRNEADAKAAAAGYRFDIERAAWPIYWIGAYCRLYEGHYAGEPLVLRGAHSQTLEVSPKKWNAGGKEWQIQRIREYMECRAAGEPCDWQMETVTRLFGWVGFSQRWQCETRRFNRGAIFVAKKNGKSPTIAAIALYLTCGDGEKGAKVFLCATNADQARDIAGAHALNMVGYSKGLYRECHVDNAKMRITHLPTRSMMQPLSSGNVRAQKSKEGLNGSAMVDEIHVVDQAFMARMVRMGASRKEPFILSFSTAGNDIDSFGYSEWVYGKEANATGSDLHYFFETHEAPQGASDADIEEHFDAYVRLANPALGHLIDMEEVRQDYQQSRVSQAKLAEFKQYRLNIWSRTETPWISMDDWQSHRRPRRLPKKNDVAWAGIDLGYVDEPSALTLVFPDDHAAIDEALANKKPIIELLGALDQPVYARTWYWLPKGAVDRWRHTLPYGEWATNKLVRVQRTTTLDLNAIEADICKILLRYDVQAFAYDPDTASPLAGNIHRDTGYPVERFWSFQQATPRVWSFGCALMERLVINGKLKHKRNAVLDWEIGHATVNPDQLGGVSLVKPQREDRKKVNGLASLIMSLDGMAKAPRHYRSQCMVIG